MITLQSESTRLGAVNPKFIYKTPFFTGKIILSPTGTDNLVELADGTAIINYAGAVTDTTPIVTTDLTTTGNTIIGDAASDTLTLNAITTLPTNQKIQFRAATQYINSSGAGTLNLAGTNIVLTGVIGLTGATTITGNAVVTGTTALQGVTTVTAASGIVGTVSGTKFGGVHCAAPSANTDSTAVSVANYYSTLTTTGAATPTLADGTFVGQMKKIQMIVDAGDASLTPATAFAGGATKITFADVGDTCELMWNGTAWQILALYNLVDGATAPVAS